ncbi:LacI family DNA-binding transcriptional regulator [uncultured Microbacterium sp.]|uniref:LacI family DNA-binding transcriptional regulator n=2 Tax=Microbacterium TaxID=33882 RepID=UPI002591E820|nr:LacI family DNA-binding transcriptional regulator [uncultured Microbacterium sp.]
MKRVTMEDVAREAGVSRALVSIAYRDAAGVSAATRARILAIGERLGYAPDQVAARLAGVGGRTVGVFIQDLHNDVFADVFDGVRAVVEPARKSLVMAVGTLDGRGDAAALDTLRRSRVDVIVGVGLQLPDVAVQAVSRHVPVVAVARDIPSVDAVITDNEAGARAAVEHLAGLGHRRIAFLANPPGDGYGGRGSGYAAAMRAAGLAPRVASSSYLRAQAAIDAAALLDGPEPPTAIFAHNDQAAFGVLDAAHDRGLVPGVDLSVVGYDNSSMSRAPGTALTTVDLHGAELGRAAAELAAERVSRPDAERLTRTSAPTLIVRGTTGLAPS